MNKMDDKMHISCLRCGRMLMKGKGYCVIDVTCSKCGCKIRATIEQAGIKLKEINESA